VNPPQVDDPASVLNASGTAFRSDTRSKGLRGGGRRRGAVAVTAAAALALSACEPDGRGIAAPLARDRSAGFSHRAPTSPAGPAPRKVLLRFAAVGDLGPGDRQLDVAQRMCRFRRNHPFDLVVTTGDNVYPAGERSQFQKAFFRPYRCLLTRGVRFRATLGNHDVRTRNGRPELREPAFGMKGRNYVVRRNGVRLVFVDSNRLRLRWLRRALSGRRNNRWKIVIFHHPVYSPGLEHGSTPGFRRVLNPIFRAKGVDLVLNGHDHLYAVTKLIKRIRYVVTGGGGRSLYSCGRAWFSRRCVSRYHFTFVRVGLRRIFVRAVPARGRFFHRFTTRGRV
jgi:3',5'-cyclic AMP phosphodiesterase CpdA